MIGLWLFLGASSCKKAQEQPKTKAEEKVKKEVVKKVRKKSQVPVAVASGDATIKIADGSGNVLGIELTNKVPVRGVQFTIEGVQMNEVRTTSRAKGFLADFNKASGIVIMVSTSGGKIAPGTGLIAEIICDKRGSASLSGKKIAR